MNKKIFYIEITETLQRLIRVEADSYEEAEVLVEESCNECRNNLDYNDFSSRTCEDLTSVYDGSTIEELPAVYDIDGCVLFEL